MTTHQIDMAIIGGFFAVLFILAPAYDRLVDRILEAFKK